MLEQTRATRIDSRADRRRSRSSARASARSWRCTPPTQTWAEAVGRLVLLAPALDFGGNRLRQLGEYGIDEWRRSGRLRVFHYARNEPRDVGFALYEDAARYDAFEVRLSVPTLVFQGTRDASVDPKMVERWASLQPRVTLRLLDDEHQLTESIETIWPETERFLGIAPH